MTQRDSFPLTTSTVCNKASDKGTLTRFAYYTICILLIYQLWSFARQHASVFRCYLTLFFTTTTFRIYNSNIFEECPTFFFIFRRRVRIALILAKSMEPEESHKRVLCKYNDAYTTWASLYYGVTSLTDGTG